MGHWHARAQTATSSHSQCAASRGVRAEFCFTTQHLREGGGGGITPPPPPSSGWAKIFSGPSANHKFSSAPLVQVSLGQTISSAPLTTQGLLRGRVPPTAPPPPTQGFFRIIKNQGGGGPLPQSPLLPSPKAPSAPPPKLPPPLPQNPLPPSPKAPSAPPPKLPPPLPQNPLPPSPDQSDHRGKKRNLQ